MDRGRDPGDYPPGWHRCARTIHLAISWRCQENPGSILLHSERLCEVHKSARDDATRHHTSNYGATRHDNFCARRDHLNHRSSPNHHHAHNRATTPNHHHAHNRATTPNHHHAVTRRAARRPNRCSLAAMDTDQLLRERLGHDEFLREHYSSPLPEEHRSDFAGLDYFPPDAAWELPGDYDPIPPRILETTQET